MNTYKFCLLLAASAIVSTTAHAQSAPASESPPFGNTKGVGPTKLLSETSLDTGTIIKKQIKWESNIPLNKTYGELTPEQKAEFHAMYESLPPGDEPPFPLEGLKPVMNAIQKAQHMIRARGELNMTVTVGPDGKATEVADSSAVNRPELMQFAASILLMTKYKPAVCAGVPCTMQFPLYLNLKGS